MTDTTETALRWWEALKEGQRVPLAFVKIDRIAAFFSQANSEQATARTMFRPKDASRRGVGGRFSPVRCWLSFQGGDDGRGNASTATVTLSRSKKGIEKLGKAGLTDVANVCWKVETNRRGFTGGKVEFLYLDSEIAGLDASRSVLYSAPDLKGPWTKVTESTCEPLRHRIRGSLPSVSTHDTADYARYFAIMAAGPGQP